MYQQHNTARALNRPTLVPPVKRKIPLVISIPLAALIAFVIVAGWDWYAYATAGEPYDEVGIELNSRMPDPMRRWACERIKARHPGTLPPHGCQG